MHNILQKYGGKREAKPYMQSYAKLYKAIQSYSKLYKAIQDK